MKRTDEQTFYGILEVSPTVTAKEIQKAYDHDKESVESDPAAVQPRPRLQVCPQRREDLSIEEEAVEEASSLSFTSLSINVEEDTTDYRGKTLKEIREGMGIDLKTVSRETRVNAKILEWVEEEILEKLPPVVYLKGFLKSYARCLGLDPQKVVERYLQFLNESKKK